MKAKYRISTRKTDLKSTCIHKEREKSTEDSKNRQEQEKQKVKQGAGRNNQRGTQIDKKDLCREQLQRIKLLITMTSSYLRRMIQ